MLTATDNFSDFQNRLGGTIATIVELKSATETWYIGDRAINLTDGYVHALLKGHSGISESFDMYRRTWAVSDVTVQISNEQYKQIAGGGDWTRLGDEIAGIRHLTAKIYLCAGEKLTSLSDCVTRFVGIVLYPPVVSDTMITVKMVAAGKIYARTVIPQAQIDSVFTDAPAHTASLKIPLAYGEYNWDIENLSETLGLARGYQTTAAKNKNSEMVFSDHALHTFSDNVYTKNDSLPNPSQFTSGTENADDSDYGTADMVFTSAAPNRANAYITPEPLDGGNLALADFTVPSNYNNAINQQSSDFSTMIDNESDVGGAGNWVAIGVFPFSFLDYATGTNNDNEIGLMYGEDVDLGGNMTFAYKIGTTEGLTPANTLMHIYNRTGSDIVPGGNLTTDGAWNTRTIDVETGAPVWPVELAWHLHSGVSSSADARYPMVLGIRCPSATGSGDGVTDNQEFLKIYGTYIKWDYSSLEFDNFYAAFKGRKYEDAWISGRSSNYSDGDMIEDPAGIIESIVRDELTTLSGAGLGDSSIDLPSFIGAENTSVKARINLTSDNEASAANVIRQIAEQSTFAFAWAASGKARLVPLNDKTPTTNRTIPYSHLVNGKITVSKSKTIINKLNIESRWRAEYDNFADTDTVEDGTSQSNLGTWTYNAQWPNIAGASKDHVSAWLVNTSDGVWSKEHNVVELETVMFTNGDLEIGDWIELDATTVDPHLKAFGVSWDGKQLLVTAIRQSTSSTFIRAVELF